NGGTCLAPIGAARREHRVTKGGLPNETRPDHRCRRFFAASGLDHRGILASRLRPGRGPGLRRCPNPEPAPCDLHLRLYLPLPDRSDVVAADLVEAASDLYGPSRTAFWRNRSGLLDGGHGKIGRGPGSSRFRQQYRPAAFLSIRAACLRLRSVDCYRAASRCLCAPLGPDWRAADSQSVARPLQRAGRVALDLFLSPGTHADLCIAPLRTQARP